MEKSGPYIQLCGRDQEVCNSFLLTVISTKLFAPNNSYIALKSEKQFETSVQFLTMFWLMSDNGQHNNIDRVFSYYNYKFIEMH